MARPLASYRAARRNTAKGNGVKFPWPCRIKTKHKTLAEVRPNKRDRSDDAEAKRAKHVTMDFTDGVAGISRSIINYTPPTLHQRKPKRGWAAARRRKPFASAFDAARMAKIAARHVHPRRQRKAT